MKRSLSTGERIVVRPVIPAISGRPESAAAQVPDGSVAAPPLEPTASAHVPMAFPGPFAYVPKPPAMQDSVTQSDPASTASSVQGNPERAASTLVLPAAGHGDSQIRHAPASEGYATGATSSATVTNPVATNDNPHGFPPLILAAFSDKLAELTVLMQDPAMDINQLDPKSGVSALMAAASRGHVAVLARLIAAGADLDLRDPSTGMTALLYGSNMNQPDAVACLLAAGAKVNLVVGPQRPTALMLAAARGHVEVVKMLLAHNDIAVNDTDASGRSALHSAADQNKPDMVACLLTAGAKVNLATGPKRHTALILAAARGHVEVVKTLLTHDDIALNDTDASGRTALQWATEHNRPDVMVCLLAAGASMTVASPGNNATLMFAIARQRAAVLEILLHHGAVLPYIDYFEAAHSAFAITMADLDADLKLPAEPEHNPLGLVAPQSLEQPLVVIDELVAALETRQDLLRWMRAKGIRMACALPVVECLAALADTWSVLTNSGQAATTHQKRLVCAAALSRLSVLTAKGEALQRYKAAGISAAGLERLSAVAMRPGFLRRRCSANWLHSRYWRRKEHWSVIPNQPRVSTCCSRSSATSSGSTASNSETQAKRHLADAVAPDHAVDAPAAVAGVHIQNFKMARSVSVVRGRDR